MFPFTNMKIDFWYLYLVSFICENIIFRLHCYATEVETWCWWTRVMELWKFWIQKYLHFKLTSFKCCFQNCQNNQQKTLPFKLLLKSAVECCQNLSLENWKLSIKTVNPVINMFKNSRFCCKYSKSLLLNVQNGYGMQV